MACASSVCSSAEDECQKETPHEILSWWNSSPKSDRHQHHDGEDKPRDQGPIYDRDCPPSLYAPQRVLPVTCRFIEVTCAIVQHKQRSADNIGAIITLPANHRHRINDLLNNLLSSTRMPRGRKNRLPHARRTFPDCRNRRSAMAFDRHVGLPNREEWHEMTLDAEGVAIKQAKFETGNQRVVWAWIEFAKEGHAWITITISRELIDKPARSIRAAKSSRR